MIPVIEAAFPAALMAGLGRPHRAPPPEPATARRAVRVPAVTRWTDREEAIALPTGLLTKGLVHGGDARRTPADWTSDPNRGTTRTTGSVCRRARRSRGPGGPVRALILSLPTLTETAGARPQRGLWTPPPPWTQTAAPTAACKTAHNAVLHSAHSRHRSTENKNQKRTTPYLGSSTIVQIGAISGECQQIGHYRRCTRHNSSDPVEKYARYELQAIHERFSAWSAQLVTEGRTFNAAIPTTKAGSRQRQRESRVLHSAASRQIGWPPALLLGTRKCDGPPVGRMALELGNRRQRPTSCTITKSTPLLTRPSKPTSIPTGQSRSASRCSMTLAAMTIS